MVGTWFIMTAFPSALSLLVSWFRSGAVRWGGAILICGAPGSGLTVPGALGAPAEAGDRARPAVEFSAAYTGEGLAVARGGLQRGVIYRGLAEIAAETDFTRLRWPGGPRLLVSAHIPHGGDFSGARLGDLQGASNIAAYNHPLLFEAWLGRNFAGERGEVRLGRLAADADFATTEGGGSFLNSSFGWPAFISANTRNTGPAYNRTATGGFLRFDLTDSVRVQAGIYDGDSFDDPDGDPSRHPNGLHFEFAHGQGIFALVELAITRAAGPGEGAGGAALKLGAWRHTAAFADQFDPTIEHAGNHGFYVAAEATLWAAAGAPARRLVAFGRGGVSPRQRSRLPQTADAGLSMTGLLPQRPADLLGFGVAWVRVSPEARRAERLAGVTPVSDYELVVELHYAVALGERWRVTPDVQWVRHPGGSAASRNALVLGLRSRVEF
jgi:porin